MGQLIHINATPEFLKNKKSMALIYKMVELASNKFMKDKYSFEELQEFKSIIINKISRAESELEVLLHDLKGNENGTGDRPLKLFESEGECIDKDEIAESANRQRKFIEQLQQALVRIETKTYGFCRETGKLIPKERLRAVPHATLSMEAKQKRKEL